METANLTQLLDTLELKLKDADEGMFKAFSIKLEEANQTVQKRAEDLRLKILELETEDDFDAIEDSETEDDFLYNDFVWNATPSNDESSTEIQQAMDDLYTTSYKDSGWPGCTRHKHKALLQLPHAPLGAITEGIVVEVLVSTMNRLDIWAETRLSISRYVPSTLGQSQPIRSQGRSNARGRRSQTHDSCWIGDDTHVQQFSANIKDGYLEGIKAISGTQSSLRRSRISLTEIMGRLRPTRTWSFDFVPTMLDIETGLTVAVNLACSILHLSCGVEHILNEGPWLQRNWQSDGFTFFEDLNDFCVDILRPYLSILPSSSSVSTTISLKNHPSLAVYSFTFILVTLFYHDIFQNCRSEILDEESGHFSAAILDPAIVNHNAILKLQNRQEYKKRYGRKIPQIIAACFSGDFLRKLLLQTSNNDLNTRIQAYRVHRAFRYKVVIPLQEIRESIGATSVGTRRIALSEPEQYTEKTVLSDLEQDAPVTVDRGGKVLEVLYSHNGVMHELDPDKVASTDDWFKRLELGVHKRIEAELRRTKKELRRVKVAILDTGISFSPKVMKIYDDQQPKKYKCFITDSKSHTDTNGHGTHCASVLLNTAKNVDLYIARVFETGQNQKGSKYLYKRIADAINYAVVTWEVDIISLSFGFQDHIPIIEDAIRAAYSKNILVFAAASNSGSNDEICYPARSRDVICVYASDGKGNKADFTPYPSKESAWNFLVLGTAVEGDWSYQCNGGKRRMSGTSCAVPIAVGIAAIILGYGHVVDLTPITSSRPSWFERLREFRRMSLLLEEMSSSSSSRDFHYLTPWKLFDKLVAQCSQMGGNIEQVFRSKIQEILVK